MNLYHVLHHCFSWVVELLTERTSDYNVNVYILMQRTMYVSGTHTEFFEWHVTQWRCVKCISSNIEVCCSSLEEICLDDDYINRDASQVIWIQMSYLPTHLIFVYSLRVSNICITKNYKGNVINIFWGYNKYKQIIKYDMSDKVKLWIWYCRLKLEPCYLLLSTKSTKLARRNTIIKRKLIISELEYRKHLPR